MKCAARATVFLALWALLAASRYEALFLPPADDQCGNWIEADYLFETGFDYKGLVTEEPHADTGGKRSYVTGILPTAVALGRRAGLSNQTLFATYRIFSLGCGALMAVFVFEALRRTLGDMGAIAVVSAILTTPLFRAQMEFTGTDAAMTNLLTIAMVLVSQQRFFLAGLMAFASFALKNTAFLGMAAMIGAVGIVWIATFRMKLVIRSTSLLLAACGYSALLAIAIGIFWYGNSIQLRLDQPVMITYALAPLCCPDLVIVILLWIGCTILLGVRALLNTTYRAGTLFPNPDPARPLLLAATFLLTAGTLIAGTRLTFHPRYWAVLVPSLFISTSMMLALTTRRPLIVFALAMPLAIFNLFNADGRYFPPLPHDIARLCTFVERSQEYIPPLLSLQAGMKVAEEAAKGSPVVVNESTIRPATVPAIGFVNHALHGYTTLQTPVPGMKHVISILQDRPQRLVVVHLNEMFRIDGEFSIPEPDESSGDRILYQDSFAQPMIVYEKIFPPNAPRQDYVDWLMRFFNGVPSMWVLEQLLAEGHYDVAKQYVEKCKQTYPDDPSITHLIELLEE